MSTALVARCQRGFVAVEAETGDPAVLDAPVAAPERLEEPIARLRELGDGLEGAA